MKCTRTPFGFVCGPDRRKRCKTPECRGKVVAECDWRLHKIVDGVKQYTGKTCDRGMCERCRTTVGVHEDGPHKGEPKDLCPAHHGEAVRRGYIRQRPPGAPAPAQLWERAGGDKDRFLELMRECGMAETVH